MFFVSLVGGKVWGQTLPRPTITDLAPGVVANPCNANLLVYGDFENLPFSCGDITPIIDVGDSLNPLSTSTGEVSSTCGYGACCMGWAYVGSNSLSVITPDYIPNSLGDTPCVSTGWCIVFV